MLLKNNVEFKEWEEEMKGVLKTVGAKRKRTFKFYLSSQYQGARQVDGKWITTFPESYSLPISYTTTLKGEACELKYTTGPAGRVKGKDGEMKYGPVDGIIFINGVLEVRADALDLLYWLQRHPRCETNPAYFTPGSDKEKKLDDNKVAAAVQQHGFFIFKERNELLEKEIAYDKKTAIIQAQSHVINSMTEKECREAYLAWEVDNQIPLKEIKNYLLVKAEENPKLFMETLNGDIRSFKAKVNEAMAAEVISYDNDKRKWRWTDTKREFLSVAKGLDAKVVLVEYLRDTDDGELMAGIDEAIKKVEAEVEA